MTHPFALIIEDDPDLAHIFDQALQSVGFYTEIVLDGQTAMTRLGRTSPPVVVLDLHLPQVTGREILRYIRTADHLAETRVILVTGDPTISTSSQLDVDLLLIKPVSFVTLRESAKRMYTAVTVG